MVQWSFSDPPEGIKSNVESINQATWKMHRLANGDSLWVPHELALRGFTMNGSSDQLSLEVSHCAFGDDVKEEWFSRPPDQWMKTFIDPGRLEDMPLLPKEKPIFPLFGDN